MASANDTTALLDENPPEAVPAENRMTDADHPTDETLAAWVERLSQPGGAGEEALPFRPASGQIDEQALADCVASLRRFHRGTPDAEDKLDPPAEAMLPALLHPLRDHSNVRSDYPLVLLPPSAEHDGPPCISLTDLLRQTLSDMAPGDDEARILKDNLPRIEHGLKRQLEANEAPVDARESLLAAAEAVAKTLSLRDETARQFIEDLERVRETMPVGTVLIGLTDSTAIRLFIHVAAHRMAARRSQLNETVASLRSRLNDLLRSDHEKSAEARQPTSLSKSVGEAGMAHIDPARLSRVIGTPRGAEPMSTERRTRLERAIEVFDAWTGQTTIPQATIVHTGTIESFDDRANWQLVKSDACAAAARIFDEHATQYAELFGSMRIARLELAGEYDPLRHDTLLQAFRWDAFSKDELLALVPVLVVESVDELAGAGMFDLSRLLLSGRPINVLVSVQPASDPVQRPGDQPLAASRFELGYLGISHREATVNQTSAARPHHLVAGFDRSLDGITSSLNVVATGRTSTDDIPPLGAWLHSGAALEGRAHPFFHYDPEAGMTWARRLDFSDNPQPESDWPIYDLPCRNQAGEGSSLRLAFTFADFALMEERYRNEFRVIPIADECEDLIPLARYLELDAEIAREHIPFIWAVDPEGQLHRLVISDTLTAACRDRQAYWQTLQELAGVRNEYVREAVAHERERAEQEAAAQHERLAQAHAEEIEHVRSETATEAMRQLAQQLLGLDPSSLTGLVSPVTAAPTTAPSPPVDEHAPADDIATPAAMEEQPEEDEDEEPWIDSALCTTCNDCLDINAQMFIYNANKQAVIGDATAGTFAQLVQAAEKCPAKCIHPGKPLNPNEPNLDELIERARPFN